jgi:type IV pilus assembly protein PilX
MTCRPVRSRQSGVALLTALVLMLVVLMMGIAAARAAIHADKSARHERDRHIAFAAAEAALADAELDIESAAATAPGRAALLEAGPSALAQGCGRGADDLGLCTDEAGTPQWQTVDLEAEIATVGYGNFTGAQMATGSGTLPALVPRYIIEIIGVTAAPPGSGRFFRITALGFGSHKTTKVVLQTFYRKPAAAAPGAPAGASPGSPTQGSGSDSGGDGKGGGSETGGDGSGSGGNGSGGATTAPSATTLPAGRIAWREVANWPELHLAALK